MIYWRNSAGQEGHMNLNDQVIYEITNIAPETYEFYGTAYDASGNESGPSNTITYEKTQDKIPEGPDMPPPTEVEANFNLIIKEVE